MKSNGTVTLIGNVGNDPTYSSQAGRERLNFRFAATDWTATEDVEGWEKGYGGKGSQRTMWVNVVIWNGYAAYLSDRVKKGQRLFLEGEWVGKSEDGQLYVRTYQTKGKKTVGAFDFMAFRVEGKGISQGWFTGWLVGNLGDDPKMQYSQNERAMTTFSVATNQFKSAKKEDDFRVPEGWEPVYEKSSGRKKGKLIGANLTTWYRLIAFGKLAERINNEASGGCKAAMRIVPSGKPVDGVLEAYGWVDEETGEAHGQHGFQAISFSLLPEKGERTGRALGDDDFEAPPSSDDFDELPAF